MNQKTKNYSFTLTVFCKNITYGFKSVLVVQLS